MELEKYINKIKRCQDENIKLQSCGYSEPIPKNLKGYMFKNKFYTPEELILLDYKKKSTVLIAN